LLPIPSASDSDDSSGGDSKPSALPGPRPHDRHFPRDPKIPHDSGAERFDHLILAQALDVNQNEKQDVEAEFRTTRRKVRPVKSEADREREQAERAAFKKEAESERLAHLLACADADGDACDFDRRAPAVCVCVFMYFMFMSR